MPADVAELSRLRVFASDFAAADSVEGQLRSAGSKWERTRAQISAGSYVQDILQGRLDQPAGRGVIGKVVSIYVDEQGRAVVNVDFGRGWVVGIFISELAPIRFVAPAIRTGGDAPSVKGQPESGLLHDLVQEQSEYTATNSFGIYLTADSEGYPECASNWTSRALSPRPLISGADILSYDFANHLMTLTPEAFQRIPPAEARDLYANSPAPFVVVVNGERIYMGLFVKAVSSASFDLPSIISPQIGRTLPPNTVRIGRAYPTDSFGAGADPRSDNRIQRALASLHKL